MPSNETSQIKKLNGSKIAAAAAAVAAIAAGGTATAIAAAPGGDVIAPLTPAANKDRNDYQQAYDQAQRYGVEPKRNLARVAPASPDIATRAAVVKLHALGAKGKQKLKEAAKPDFASPESLGVSQSTLDAIASCESGGNPAAVDASGTYYGLYQFDFGTWASVGGSGSPADASAAEQSYRAALLYSRSGSSPWPVCGQ